MKKILVLLIALMLVFIANAEETREELLARRAEELLISRPTIDLSIERLSSGARISQDADEFKIAPRMRTQIEALDQPSTNAQGGLGVSQTAADALSDMSGITAKARELTQQDADANRDEVANYQKEIAELTSEIEKLSEEMKPESAQTDRIELPSLTPENRLPRADIIVNTHENTDQLLEKLRSGHTLPER